MGLAEGVQLTGVPLDDLFLDVKLSIPEARPAVSRAQLYENARASNRRLVGVVAPAGYGKTTLLAEWAGTEDRAVAWVSLDRLDDDPAVLLTVLAAAFAQATSDDSSLVSDIRRLGLSALSRAAPRLASAFRASSVPFVLMVDDFHELQSPSCHDVFWLVAAGIPRGSQLVFASRVEPVHWPRLLASDDAMQFGATDLAVDAVGAEQILAAAHIAVTHEVAATVATRTEGWPVGVYLAALILKENHGDVSSIGGDDRLIADYLYAEMLAQLPEKTQRFLRSTAVLDRLSGALCDAVVGEPGSAGQLRSLEASNLLLVPIDRHHGWYRYHGLFREFLLAELDRVDPTIGATLHLRAGDWFEANGSPAVALEHLLQTQERDRRARLITALTLPTYNSGQISTIERWLATLGDAAIQAYPPLAVLMGWLRALTGRAAEAQRWAAIIDTASFDGIPADGTASFESARSMLRAIMCPAGPAQAVADATFALSAEPSWSAWRGQALTMGGEAYLLIGEIDQARALFTQTVESAEMSYDADSAVLSYSELALLAMDEGRWEAADDHLRLASATIDERRMDDYAMSVLAFAAAARGALHDGDLVRSRREASRAMRARPSLTWALPSLAVRVRVVLARVNLGLGESTTARHLLHEIDDIMRERPDLGVLVGQVVDLRLVMAAAESAYPGGPSPLSPAEIRLLPYLQTHLTFREVAARLSVSRNTVASEVSSIYRKLGASSRSEAVQQATIAGLLGT